MSAVLQEIAVATGDGRFKNPQQVRAHYVDHPDRILCSVAEDGSGDILGFQSLKRASERNPYGVQPGWGIIGTHISPRASRRGVGASLFAATLQAAQNVGLTCIDATIGRHNTGGLAYYASLGFIDYRATPDAICKCYRLVR